MFLPVFTRPSRRRNFLPSSQRKHDDTPRRDAAEPARIPGAPSSPPLSDRRSSRPLACPASPERNSACSAIRSALWRAETPLSLARPIASQLDHHRSSRLESPRIGGSIRSYRTCAGRVWDRVYLGGAFIVEPDCRIPNQHRGNTKSISFDRELEVDVVALSDSFAVSFLQFALTGVLAIVDEPVVRT